MCHGIGTSVCRYFASLFVCLFVYLFILINSTPIWIYLLTYLFKFHMINSQLYWMSGMLLIMCLATILVDWNFLKSFAANLPEYFVKRDQNSVLRFVLNVKQNFDHVVFFSMELNRVVYQYSIVDSIIFAICSATIWNSWLVPVPNTSQHISRSGTNSLSRAVKFLIS